MERKRETVMMIGILYRCWLLQEEKVFVENPVEVGENRFVRWWKLADPILCLQSSFVEFLSYSPSPGPIRLFSFFCFFSSSEMVKPKMALIPFKRRDDGWMKHSGSWNVSINFWNVPCLLIMIDYLFYLFIQFLRWRVPAPLGTNISAR